MCVCNSTADYLFCLANKTLLSSAVQLMNRCTHLCVSHRSHTQIHTVSLALLPAHLYYAFRPSYQQAQWSMVIISHSRERSDDKQNVRYQVPQSCSLQSIDCHMKKLHKVIYQHIISSFLSNLSKFLNSQVSATSVNEFMKKRENKTCLYHMPC